MKKMKKTIKLVSILLLAMLVVVSCSPEKTMDGKTAATKKQMTSTEYSQNREAIRSVTVVEAYAVANPELAESATRALSGEQVLRFKEETEVSTSEIIKNLKTLASAEGATEAEEAFYNSLAASLPADFKVSVMSDSFVKYNIDETGVKTITSLDITIKVGDKTIEIEKDVDDKWIEIDGTFFDDTELEKMLDAAEDAAEAIEELFKNLDKIKIDLPTLNNGGHKEFSIEIKDGEKLEARIEGSATFKIEDKKLSTSFDFKYIEYEDDVEKVDEAFNIKASLKLDLNLTPTAFEHLNLNNIPDISVTINGMEVWADAFLDELD